MSISSAQLEVIKSDLKAVVTESLNNLTEIVLKKEHIFINNNYDNFNISSLFVDAFFEYCAVEEPSANGMQSTINKTNARIETAESLDFEKAGLYGSQLNTKIALVNHAWSKFNFGTIIDLKRWVECLKSLMMSILAITGADEALKEQFDMITNILSDQVDNQLTQ